MKRKQYYKEFDLSKFTNGLKITDKNLQKHKVFLTKLLTETNYKGYFSQAEMIDIFGHNYYCNELGRNTRLGNTYEFENKENIWTFENIGSVKENLETFEDRNKKTKKIKKSMLDDNILFCRLFRIIKTGDNKRGINTLFGLNIKKDENIEYLVNDELETIDEIRNNDLLDLEEQYKQLKAKRIVVDYSKNKDIIVNELKLNIDKLQPIFEEYKFKINNTNCKDLGLEQAQLDSKIRRAKKFELLVESLSDEIVNGTAVINICSEIKKSGRMYNEEQGMDKDVRSISLTGYTEYDINEAAPTFFTQVFKQINTDTKYLDKFITKHTKEKNFEKVELLEKIKLGYKTVLDRYTTTDKLKIRQSIASVIKGEEIQFNGKQTVYKEDKKFLDLSKEVLTMVFFGALTKNKKYSKKYLNIDTENMLVRDEDIEIKKGTAIQEALKKKIYVDRFFNSELVQEFLNTVDVVMEIIYDYLKENNMNKDKSILKVNKTELTLDYINRNKFEENTAKTISKAKALAHFYQSWESKAIKAIRKAYTKEVGYYNNYYLSIHDGIYIYKNVDKQILEDSTKNLKGVDFNINITVD